MGGVRVWRGVRAWREGGGGGWVHMDTEEEEEEKGERLYFFIADRRFRIMRLRNFDSCVQCPLGMPAPSRDRTWGWNDTHYTVGVGNSPSCWGKNAAPHACTTIAFTVLLRLPDTLRQCPRGSRV